MRIALVAENYYPQLGGVPEHVHHMAVELNRRGHTATVVTSHMRGVRDDPSFVQRVGASVVIYANGGVSRVTAGWRLVGRLTELFRDGHFDVVHVHGGLAPTFGIAAPMAAWKAGIPLVATFHSWFPRSVGYRLARRPLQRMLDRHDARIAVSEPVIQAMSRYFRADWEIIPNGVDLNYFHPNGGRPAGSATRGPRLLFSRGWSRGMGYPRCSTRCPASCTAFPTRASRWRGMVRGAGTTSGAPARLGVAWSSSGASSKTARCTMATRISILPDRPRVFGVTLLEAMACGTPLVWQTTSVSARSCAMEWKRSSYRRRSRDLGRHHHRPARGSRAA